MKNGSPEFAAAKLLRRTRLRPTMAVVLGTGFHSCLDSLDPDMHVSYDKLPGFAPVGVTGHRGELTVGRIGKHALMVLRGRAHYYEGHAMSLVTAAVRIVAACGIRALLLTNAAGGINRRFRVGDFMVIKDHINLMGVNPLRGRHGPDSHRFIDLSRVYDERLQRLLHRAGKDIGLRLRTGVYTAVSGPSYETPAEIVAFGRLGADAVGMSTVPEAIVARQCGLQVAGLSCITNLAAGLAKAPLSHHEVLQNARKTGAAANQLLHRFVALYGDGTEVSG